MLPIPKSAKLSHVDFLTLEKLVRETELQIKWNDKENVLRNHPINTSYVLKNEV